MRKRITIAIIALALLPTALWAVQDETFDNWIPVYGIRSNDTLIVRDRGDIGGSLDMWELEWRTPRELIDPPHYIAGLALAMQGPEVDKIIVAACEARGWYCRPLPER